METTALKNDFNPHIAELQDGILNLILKKTGVTYNDLIEHSKKRFIIQNLDVISEDEAKKFKDILLFYGQHTIYNK